MNLDEGAVTVSVSFNLRFKLKEKHINLPNYYWPNLGHVPTTYLFRCFLRAKLSYYSHKNLDWMPGRPKQHMSTKL